jgi:hypothetical protein
MSKQMTKAEIEFYFEKLNDMMADVAHVIIPPFEIQ